MKISIQLEPAPDPATTPEVQYTWDADTEILSAQLKPQAKGDGMSGSVGLEGSDGSWVILDVSAGCINGVEVAVWPDVRNLPVLAPPANVETFRVTVPSRRSQPVIASLETNTRLVAEADRGRTIIHFRLGNPKQTRTVRVARDLLLDVDDHSRLTGLWLLNVPPAPVEA